jgi:hypothetical protein
MCVPPDESRTGTDAEIEVGCAGSSLLDVLCLEHQKVHAGLCELAEILRLGVT